MADATVSISVTEMEQSKIRTVASRASLTVSEWAKARINRAMASSRTRATVREILAERVPGIKRGSRISTVLDEKDHGFVKACAIQFSSTVHALCQAIVLDAVATEFDELPVNERDLIHARVKTAVNARSTLIALPAAMANEVEAEPRIMASALGVLDQLLEAARREILAGKGDAMSSGIVASTARRNGAAMLPLQFMIPPDRFRHIAWVLGLDKEELATALGIKAAKVAIALED